VQAIAVHLEFQLLERDSVAKRIRKRDVRLAGAGEIREKFDGVAYIHDDKERRPALRRGERLGVLLSLIAGAKHCLVPPRRSAHSRTAAMRHLEKQRWFGSLAALFGLQYETAAFVQVDESRARESRRVPEDDRPLEDIMIEAVLLDCGLRPRDVQVIA